MAVPWLQIVQLMPTILDVSKELLKRAKRSPPPPSAPALPADSPAAALQARIVALEENERRQAELISNMADQLAQLTAAATVLHKQVKRLMVGQATALVVALVALIVALF
ncbi:MAG TPA: hypothetical protein VFR59_01565 [Steroidobacteraceae bacterium]|nr:hypothetical protein [Steroidobacteraceae bacterium]